MQKAKERTEGVMQGETVTESSLGLKCKKERG